MYEYWINLASLEGTTYDGRNRYVWLLTTRPVNNKDTFEAQVEAMQEAFPSPQYKLTKYRRVAQYEEIV